MTPGGRSIGRAIMAEEDARRRLARALEMGCGLTHRTGSRLDHCPTCRRAPACEHVWASEMCDADRGDDFCVRCGLRGGAP